jgi:hypothetical protein
MVQNRKVALVTGAPRELAAPLRWDLPRRDSIWSSTTAGVSRQNLQSELAASRVVW